MSTKKVPDKEDKYLFEKKVLDAGYKCVAGIDEAGRGPLAGPVAASAVVVRENDFIQRIDDSKKLTAKRRERAFIEILDKCDVGVGMASVEEIDRLNILNATLLAMERAVHDLIGYPDYLLIDGNMKVSLEQDRTYLIRGESKSVSIACASIIAKVVRDKLMVENDRKYPGYGFAQHKGYGTKSHIEAIRQLGLSPIHRKTFGPFGGKKERD